MEFVTSVDVQVFEYEDYEINMTGEATILHTWSPEYPRLNEFYESLGELPIIAGLPDWWGHHGLRYSPNMDADFQKCINNWQDFLEYLQGPSRVLEFHYLPNV